MARRSHASDRVKQANGTAAPSQADGLWSGFPGQGILPVRGTATHALKETHQRDSWLTAAAGLASKTSSQQDYRPC